MSEDGTYHRTPRNIIASILCAGCRCKGILIYEGACHEFTRIFTFGTHKVLEFDKMSVHIDDNIDTLLECHHAAGITFFKIKCDLDCVTYDVQLWQVSNI